MKNEKIASPAVEQNKLTLLGAIKYIICYSSVVFTAISLMLLISQSLTASKVGVVFADPARFRAIYPFTLCTAAAGLVFKTKMKMWTKLLIHYAVTIVSFYLFVCSPIKSSTNPVAIIALASLIYLLGAAADLIIRAAINKKKRDDTPYQSVYSKITKK